MFYKGYAIERADPKVLETGKRTGVYAIYDPDGHLLDTAEYTIGNSYSRTYALSSAKARVDRARAARMQRD